MKTLTHRWKPIAWMAVVFVFFASNAAQAQVGAIKGASRSNSGGGGSGSSGRSSGGGGRSDGGFNGGGAFFFFEAARGVAVWQAYKLRQRGDVPSVVSLEIMSQVALQPPANYWLLPRVRANWGLVSTDFRYNFLIENDQLGGGLQSLGTYDWQVFQMNWVTTKPVTVRGGMGFMAENFGERAAFFEATLATDLRFQEGKIGGGAEYRVAKDGTATPRREFNARVEYRVWQWRRLNGYATLGGIFQRYYDVVDVWGVQTGLIFRIQ